MERRAEEGKCRVIDQKGGWECGLWATRYLEQALREARFEGRIPPASVSQQGARLNKFMCSKMVTSRHLDYARSLLRLEDRAAAVHLQHHHLRHQQQVQQLHMMHHHQHNQLNSQTLRYRGKLGMAWVRGYIKVQAPSMITYVESARTHFGN